VKAKELTERTDEALNELEKSIQNDIFQARFKNFTNRLNDTASVKRLRRDLARVKTVLTQRSTTARQRTSGATTDSGKAS
jgi:large subunit ribosomal protein L29